MLHFLSSLFATSSRRDDPVDKALLERATERVLEGSDPRLRALPGYRKRLRAPVETAVEGVLLAGTVQGPKDIVDTAVAAGSFNTLVAALQAADLVDTLKGPGPFTVFAPTDEAFGKLQIIFLDNPYQNLRHYP